MEADLQRFYNIDYRRRFVGDLTIRRLLVLVDQLPPESAFKSAIEGRVQISHTDSLLMDVWSALTGKQHGRWDVLKKAKDRAERETKRKQRLKAAREHNRRALEARKNSS